MLDFYPGKVGTVKGKSSGLYGARTITVLSPKPNIIVLATMVSEDLGDSLDFEVSMGSEWHEKIVDIKVDTLDAEGSVLESETAAVRVNGYLRGEASAGLKAVIWALNQVSIVELGELVIAALGEERRIDAAEKETAKLAIYKAYAHMDRSVERERVAREFAHALSTGGWDGISQKVAVVVQGTFVKVAALMMAEGLARQAIAVQEAAEAASVLATVVDRGINMQLSLIKE